MRKEILGSKYSSKKICLRKKKTFYNYFPYKMKFLQLKSKSLFLKFKKIFFCFFFLISKKYVELHLDKCYVEMFKKNYNVFSFNCILLTLIHTNLFFKY